MSSCPTRHRLTDLASCGAIRTAGRSILVHPRMPGARVREAARLHLTEGARLVQARGTVQDIRRRIAGAFTAHTGALLDDALVLATLSALPEAERMRLLLTIDAADACGGADDAPVTVAA